MESFGVELDVCVYMKNVCCVTSFIFKCDMQSGMYVVLTPVFGIFIRLCRAKLTSKMRTCIFLQL